MTLIAFSVVLVALLCSLAVNVSLLRKSRSYARLFHAARLDPLALNLYPTETQQVDPMNTQQTRVVLFGDSRAVQWRAPASNHQFLFINRGADGQTSSQALIRFDYHIPPVKPDVLVIQVGVNDLSAIPLFPSQQEEIIAECKENIAKIVTKARALGATVVLTTIFPPGPLPFELRTFSSVDVAAAVADVNTFIGSLAGEGVVIFDAAALLADEQGLIREEYSLDFLHINAAGYAVLNEHLMRLLATL